MEHPSEQFNEGAGEKEGTIHTYTSAGCTKNSLAATLVTKLYSKRVSIAGRFQTKPPGYVLCITIGFLKSSLFYDCFFLFSAFSLTISILPTKDDFEVTDSWLNHHLSN